MCRVQIPSKWEYHAHNEWLNASATNLAISNVNDNDNAFFNPGPGYISTYALIFTKLIYWLRMNISLVFAFGWYLYVKDVVTPYTHISEASRYILYTIILTFDGICTISWSWVKMWSLNDVARFSTAQRKTARSEMTQYRDVLTGSRGKSRRSRRRFLFKQTQSQPSLGSQSDE